jgi:hypothetical protein
MAPDEQASVLGQTAAATGFEGLDENTMDKKQQIQVCYFVAAFMLLLLAQSWFSQEVVLGFRPVFRRVKL